MDGDLHRSGQRGNVELEVRGLDTEVPRPTVLPPGVHANTLLPRRAPRPGQCAPLRPGYQHQRTPLLSALSAMK
jgi:hypothetical protein